MKQYKTDASKTANLQIAAISLNTHALNHQLHKKALLQSATLAKTKGAELVLYPELSLSGYGCEDMFLNRDWLNELELTLLELIDEFPKDLIGCIGLPLFHQGHCFNVMAVISHKELYGFYAKQKLAKDGIHYEPRWFSAWPKDLVEPIRFHRFNTKIGSTVFSYKGRLFGFEICEDAWQEDRVALQYVNIALSLLLNPSASHFALEKYKKRQEIVLNGSSLLKASYVYCNLLGCEAGRAVYDGGNLFAFNGQWVYQGKRFSFERFYLDLVSCPYPLKESSVSKNDSIIEIPLINTKPIRFKGSNVSLTPFNPFEEVMNAIMLGLWDWQVKTKTNGFTVSLSGGADSSLCAACVYLAHKKAQTTFGLEGYLAEMGREDSHLCEKEIFSKVLTTVYQKTKFSSVETEMAARNLSNELGSIHLSWEIDSLVENYTNMVTTALGSSPLTFRDNDLALQNIQARVRAPGIWLIANLKNQLLIATSNLSEASVGYCTMDGDTAGVLSPISGLCKSFILALNKHLAEIGIRFSEQDNEHYKLASLEVVTTLTPSAELRPSEQSDEEDLMPYELLDFIRSAQQVDNLSKREIKEKLFNEESFKLYDKNQLMLYVERYFQLYQRNQWKRERIATGFHLEVDSCCPKTYRRYPVLSMLE